MDSGELHKKIRSHDVNAVVSMVRTRGDSNGKWRCKSALEVALRSWERRKHRGPTDRLEFYLLLTTLVRAFDVPAKTHDGTQILVRAAQLSPEAVSIVFAGYDLAVSDLENPLGCLAHELPTESIRNSLTLLVRLGFSPMEVLPSNDSPLSIASSAGHADSVRAMLAGVGSACRPRVVDSLDGQGLSPLAWSSTLAKYRCVEVLLEFGASPSPGGALSPILMASRLGNFYLLRMLLAGGVVDTKVVGAAIRELKEDARGPREKLSNQFSFVEKPSFIHCIDENGQVYIQLLDAGGFMVGLMYTNHRECLAELEKHGFR